MDHLDKEVIESLSEPAKRVFKSLDYRSKRGTHELSDCLTKAKCQSANDIKGISLALQGYNFGNGYIDWALKNYGCYTKENAGIFSAKMCAELGCSSYGDTEYVPHVLRYYVMKKKPVYPMNPPKRF